MLSARCRIASLGILALASLIPVIALAHSTNWIQVRRDEKRVDRLQLMRYLPLGATVKNRTKQIVFADLDGDGQQEVIIFYSLGQDPNSHQANITILTSNPEGYSKIWENLGDGSWGFAEPTGVFDLNKTGRPQIFAYRTVGASCSGSLEIYEYEDGIIKRLTGDWGFEGHCESVELSILSRFGKRFSVQMSISLLGSILFNIDAGEGLLPLVVQDITGDGQPEIVLAPGPSASLGGWLEAYDVDGKHFRRVAHINGRYFRFRSRVGDRPFLITSRWMEEDDENLYKWNGTEFQSISVPRS